MNLSEGKDTFNLCLNSLRLRAFARDFYVEFLVHLITKYPQPKCRQAHFSEVRSFIPQSRFSCSDARPWVATEPFLPLGPSFHNLDFVLRQPVRRRVDLSVEGFALKSEAVHFGVGFGFMSNIRDEINVRRRDVQLNVPTITFPQSQSPLPSTRITRTPPHRSAVGGLSAFLHPSYQPKTSVVGGYVAIIPLTDSSVSNSVNRYSCDKF